MILGYRVEQAYRSLLELGAVTARIKAVGKRAAGPLASAGRQAFARGDRPAAVDLALAA